MDASTRTGLRQVSDKIGDVLALSSKLTRALDEHERARAVYKLDPSLRTQADVDLAGEVLAAVTQEVRAHPLYPKVAGVFGE